MNDRRDSPMGIFEGYGEYDPTDHAKLIHDTIRDAFQALYPKANIIVHGAGTESLTVCVQHGTEYLQGFSFEVPSDDDGNFYFQNDTDRTVIVMFPYPDGLEDVE